MSEVGFYSYETVKKIVKIEEKHLISEFVEDLKTVAKYQYGESWQCDAILEKWEEKLK